jgi:hypothetical protein
VNAAKTAGVCLVLAGIVLALFPAGCERRPVIETWEKTFGGDTTDKGCSVRPTSDGGYIVAGYTRSEGAGRSDAWLVKTDAGGNKLWDKFFGGENPDMAESAEPTADGGHIVIGSTWSYGAGGWDAWLIKTDANGNEEWSKTFGGPEHDYGESGQQTADGGYVIAGTTESYADSSHNDIWLIKIDPNGNESWSATFTGEGGYSGANSVQQTRDGGYIVTGWTSPISGEQGSGDLALIKTDTVGNLSWSLALGGADQEWGNSVQQTTDGGYVVVGFARSVAGNNDVWLVKTDSAGDVTWKRTFGTDSTECGNSVQQTADGGYVIAGYAAPHGYETRDAWIIKTDGDGILVRDTTFGGPGADEALSVMQTSDGGYVVTGYTTSSGAGFEDVWLFKTD